MDSKKQKLLIELLISSPDTFALCQNIVDPSYFDPEFRNSVEFVKKYYDDYSTTPSVKQIEAEANQVFRMHDVARDEIKYCAAEIEKFCKQGAMKKASLALPGLIKEEKYAEASEMVKEAVLVSLTKELGLRYFETVEERLERMLNEDPTFPTGWTGVDNALFGGISRKELLLVSANSGGGKSITLANLAFNFANQGQNVLYISLELSEDIVAQRFDTMFTGVSRRIWKDNIDKITERVTTAAKDAGIIDIIQMPSGTTPNQIRAYLKEFYLHYNMTPDLLVIDYLDKMSPNERVSADNVFEKDKRSSEQIRDIGVDYNMFIATASQLNRSAIGATEHDHSQIAGGISKINEADVYWSIIMTDEMKAQGKCIFIFQKTRNSDGVGTRVHLKWDAKYLRIVDDENGDPTPLTFNPRESDESSNILDSDKPTGDKLTSLLSSFTL
jgi:replicative DNA helicase